MKKSFVKLLFLFMVLMVIAACGSGGGSGFGDVSTAATNTTTTSTTTAADSICEGNSASPVPLTIGVTRHSTVCAGSFSMYSYETSTFDGSYYIRLDNISAGLNLREFVSLTSTGSGVGGCNQIAGTNSLLCDVASTASTTYYLRMNNSGPDGSFDMTIIKPIPSVPDGVQVTALSSGYSKVQWNAVYSTPTVSYYNVYRSTVLGITIGGAGVSTAVSKSYVYLDQGLTSGARYYYAVTAVNIVGESALSSEVSVTALP